jgi:hypothetical protein
VPISDKMGPPRTMVISLIVPNSLVANSNDRGFSGFGALVVSLAMRRALHGITRSMVRFGGRENVKVLGPGLKPQL